MDLSNDLDIEQWDAFEGDGEVLEGKFLFFQTRTVLVTSPDQQSPGFITSITRLGGPVLYSHTGFDRGAERSAALKWLASYRLRSVQ
jgi:hypothetical protein